MDDAAVESTLSECEAALKRSGPIDLRAFWKVVAAVKRDPDLAERYAERIARIDREAFLRFAGPLVFPAALGAALLSLGAVAGAALVGAAPSVRPPWREILYLAGAGALIGSTHGLAHWVVGTIVGIRFTHWYSRPPASPQPGFKTDYASYLRTPARSRAWMHASGALVTKIVPFIVAALAAANGAAVWAVWLLLAIGVVQLATDVLFSLRASDWKKFRREMSFANEP